MEQGEWPLNIHSLSPQHFPFTYSHPAPRPPLSSGTKTSWQTNDKVSSRHQQPPPSPSLPPPPPSICWLVGPGETFTKDLFY